MNYIYYFKNYNDEIIYVGRTKDIKRRMKEHFVKGHLNKDCYNETDIIMYAKINESKYDTEICETLLINKYKPKYNTEKMWNENYDKTSYELIEMEFKPLYVYFLDDKFSVNLDNFIYPCYLSNNIKDKCINLIDYNLGNLKHRSGIYRNLNNNIFKKHRYLNSVLIDLHKLVRKNILFEESNLDEPISDNGDLDLSYVVFNIKILEKMKLSIETLSLLIHCGYIFRIDDEKYAIPLHTKNVLKTIEYKYLN